MTTTTTRQRQLDRRLWIGLGQTAGDGFQERIGECALVQRLAILVRRDNATLDQRRAPLLDAMRGRRCEQVQTVGHATGQAIGARFDNKRLGRHSIGRHAYIAGGED